MTPDTAALRALADHAAPMGNPVWLDPGTVRALCDAADEVERLHRRLADTQATLDGAGVEVERLREEASGWSIGARLAHRNFLAATAERDASRTAHAAHVAGIETGLRESACAECDHDRCATYRSAASWVRDYAALDHHAPTTGATP